MVQRLVDPGSGVLVARWLPVFGPVLHHEHEAQCPDLRVGRQFLVFEVGALGLGQGGHGTAHVHQLGVVAALVFQRLHRRGQRGRHLGAATRPQRHELLKLRGVGEVGAVFLGCGGQRTGAQQHGQELRRLHRAARAQQRGHGAFAELPLRHVFAARAQIVQDGVERIKVFVVHRLGQGFRAHVEAGSGFMMRAV
ncbi:hypothetical protein D9M69_596730 [compost metagenome]